MAALRRAEARGSDISTNRGGVGSKNENLVGRSLARLSVSGIDAGVDQPRPRTGLAPSEVGLGIRFFGSVRFGSSVLVEIRFFKN